MFHRVSRRGPAALLLVAGVTAVVLAEQPLEQQRRVPAQPDNLSLQVSVTGTNGNRVQVSSDVNQLRIEQLRRTYPLQSLTRRMAYEQVAVPKGIEAGAVRLSAAGEAALRRMEADYRNRPAEEYFGRRDALRKLHSNQVEDFIDSPGQGRGRTLTINPSHFLPFPERRPVDFARAAPLSGAEERVLPAPLGGDPTPAPQSLPVTNGGAAVPPPDAGAREIQVMTAALLAPTPTLRGAAMPSRVMAERLHRESVIDFAPVDSFGYVRNRDEVAGFVQHAFHFRPQIPAEEKLTRFLSQPTVGAEAFTAAGAFQDAPELESRWDGQLPIGPHVPRRPDWGRWPVTRLELVSLLKHETPRVYLSDKLPRMADLNDGPTRAPTPFETEALAALRAGEELHTAATPNRLEMVGAVRAAKQCLQCHNVPRGTLLGAFSYELRRDPPIAIKPSGDAVQ